MITVRIAQPENNGYKNFFVCPMCKTEDWFYTFWPEKCAGCLKRFPYNGDEIMVNLDRRIHYHTEGV